MFCNFEKNLYRLMLITSVDRIWKFLTARFGTPFNIIYHDTKRSGVQPKEIWVFRQYRIPMETQKAPALGPAYQGAPWGLCWCIQKGIKGKRERKKMKQNEIWEKQGRIHGSISRKRWAGALMEVRLLFGLISTVKKMRDGTTDRRTDRP